MCVDHLLSTTGFGKVAELDVYGALVAEGTDDAPVILTAASGAVSPSVRRYGKVSGVIPRHAGPAVKRSEHMNEIIVYLR